MEVAGEEVHLEQLAKRMLTKSPPCATSARCGAWSLIAAAGAAGSRALAVQPRRRPLGAAHQRLAFARLCWENLDLVDRIGQELLLLPTYSLQHFSPSGVAGVLEPFSSDGLIYSLATSMGERHWRNPHLSGDVVCCWSSVAEYSDESRFVSHPSEQPHIHCSQTQPCFFLTDTERRLAPPDDAWMAVDLGRSIVLEHYALRNDGCGEDALRHWELQGALSLDGPWTTLRIHSADTTLAQEAYAEAIWRVNDEDACNTAFRCFRILQRSRHGSDTDFAIACAGIELYGWLQSAP